MELPSGTVTFLFTDVEGSTTLWEKDPAGMRAALQLHNEILAKAISAHGGHWFKTIGDAVQAAFPDPEEAIQAAIVAQRGLTAAKWPWPVGLKVRMGIHTGPAQADGQDYAISHTLNRVARIMSAGHGGQILISNPAAQLLNSPQGFVLRDFGEHRVKGLAQLEHIFQVQPPDLRADFPPLHTLDGTRTNLPVQLTSFIGHERDITLVKGHLAANRLVTLVGPGGTGKTRLTIQAAVEKLTDFPDGVWFIELAALSDPGRLPRSVATVFGLQEEGGQPIQQTLESFLAEKELLLVLDN